ncbi:MAG: flagellar biosynthesis protein FlhB [Deltaproteobacteria bacterium]|nr:flagellar biosynthesis protein FlhB [Deltaproteobacteria bacterium]
MPFPSDSSGEERTETATPFRREEFRKRGNVAVSREVISIALLLMIGGSLYFAISGFFKGFQFLANQYFQFSSIHDYGKGQVVDIAIELFKSWGWMVGPVLMVAVIAGIVACTAQVGFYVTWEPLSPDWNRINPVNGFQRLFSSQAAVDVLKTLIKLVVCTAIVWWIIQSQLNGAPSYFGKSIPELLSAMLGAMGKAFFAIVGALSVFAILDYGYQRFRHERQMKMTRTEAKEEFKLREGDPLVRSRIKSIQRRIASRRMMESVPKADVVVTNPTHLAVALKYDSDTMHAPKVTAKGAGVVAEKIRAIAQFHHVPLVENKPLARTLFRELDVGDFIPKELYKAVAEVLAYVYRLRGVGYRQAANHG